MTLLYSIYSTVLLKACLRLFLKYPTIHPRVEMVILQELFHRKVPHRRLCHRRVLWRERTLFWFHTQYALAMGDRVWDGVLMRSISPGVRLKAW